MTGSFPSSPECRPRVCTWVSASVCVVLSALLPKRPASQWRWTQRERNLPQSPQVLPTVCPPPRWLPGAWPGHVLFASLQTQFPGVPLSSPLGLAHAQQTTNDRGRPGFLFLVLTSTADSGHKATGPEGGSKDGPLAGQVVCGLANRHPPASQIQPGCLPLPLPRAQAELPAQPHLLALAHPGSQLG